ncbi:MAG TPA: hypothetical protein VIY49_21360 [Bryobacteraceae bacterium]
MTIRLILSPRVWPHSGAEACESPYQAARINRLRTNAAQLGYEIVAKLTTAQAHLAWTSR